MRSRSSDSGGPRRNGHGDHPERTLTVDPAESRIGSTIGLRGTGWPTGINANLVAIYYDKIRYTTATTGSSGQWAASITVPDAASVGMTHTVEAKATVGEGTTPNVTADEDHKTPDPVVTPLSGPGAAWKPRHRFG